MYRGHTVGVVVPAYNEAPFVGTVIDTMPAFVDYVYAVDDRSTDGTWDEICARSTSHDPVDGVAIPVADGSVTRTTDTDGGVVTDDAAPIVVPIRHERNRGVGAAICTGYRRSLEDGVDVTAVMAGDGQMDPDQLERLLDPVVDGRADYAKGNRLRDRAAAESMSRFRLFGNGLLSMLTKMASGYWPLLDPQNGYTAISRDALEAIDLESLYESYGFSNDLLVALNTHGFRVADVSMPAVYGQEESYIAYRSFVPSLSWLLLRGFVRRLGVRYAWRDFHPLIGLYALGVGGIAIALGRVLRSASRRRESDQSEDSDGQWGLAGWFWASTFAVVLAMIFDRLANEELVVTVE